MVRIDDPMINLTQYIKLWLAFSILNHYFSESAMMRIKTQLSFQPPI